MEVIAILSRLEPMLDGLDSGALTDDERAAIKAARAVLDMADVLSGDDPTADMIFRVTRLIPWERLAALMLTWRKLVVNAQRLAIGLPELGPDVEIVE
jgi:hypothetical protein